MKMIVFDEFYSKIWNIHLIRQKLQTSIFKFFLDKNWIEQNKSQGNESCWFSCLYNKRVIFTMGIMVRIRQIVIMLACLQKTTGGTWTTERWNGSGWHLLLNFEKHGVVCSPAKYWVQTNEQVPDGWGVDSKLRLDERHSRTQRRAGFTGSWATSLHS